MFFQRFMNKFCCFLVLLPLLSGVWAAAAAQKAQVQVAPPHYANQTIAEKYLPVSLPRKNINQPSSTEHWGPYGRPLYAHSELWQSKAVFASGQNLGQHPWRYVVAVSCRRAEGAPKKIIESLIKNMLPETERQNRLAIILGINEQMNGFDEGDRSRWCGVSEIMSEADLKELEEYGVPILILYSQWTSYRQNPENPKLTADKVREEIYKELEELKNKNKDHRPYEAQLKILKEQDEKGTGIAGGKAHSFPFGKMRTDLINCDASKKFIASLYDGHNGLWLQVQDSDVTDYRAKPSFYHFGQQTVVRDGEPFLFKRYDALIDHRYKSRQCMPVLLGGAYDYNPTEEVNFPDVKHKHMSASLASKKLSCFVIELSNLAEHIIGEDNPYGLYLHEPNTLLLLYPPKDREIAGGKKLANPLDRELITFGNFSEMQEFTRSFLADCTEQERADAMVFDAQCVIGTSMKRGAGKTPFNIYYDGTFSQETNRFVSGKEGITKTIQHMNNMPQGYMQPRDWRGPVQTGYEHCMERGATGSLEALCRCFDPYWLSGGSKGFTQATFIGVLLNYNKLVRNQLQALANYREQLVQSYNRQKTGQERACRIISLFWELGQAKRFMFMDAFRLPQDWKTPQDFVGIREHLRKRLDHYRDPNSHFISAEHEQFFTDMAKQAPIALAVNPEGKAKQKLVSELIRAVEKVKGTKAATAKVFKSTPKTIEKLKGEKGAPRSMKKFLDFLLSSQDVFGLEANTFQGFKTRATALQPINTNKPAAKQEVTQQTVTAQTTPTAPTKALVLPQAQSVVRQQALTAPQKQSSVSASSSCATSSSFGSSALVIAPAQAQIVAPKVAHRLPATDKELAYEIVQAVYVAQKSAKVQVAKVLEISVRTLDRLRDHNEGAPVKAAELVKKFKKSSSKELQDEWGLTKSQVEELKKTAGL